MPASTKPPKNTSGSGFDYEELVGGWYVVLMLAGSPPFGEDLGRIEQVAFQGNVDGWFLDDVVLRLRRGAAVHHVALSVKSNTQFGVQTAPNDFVKTAWEQLLGVGHSAFIEGSDFIGLVTTPLNPELREALEYVRSVSSHTPRADIPTRMQDEGFSSPLRQALYASFACPSSLAGQLAAGDGSAARLLAASQFEQFDFHREASQDETRAIDRCQELLAHGDRAQAGNLWRAILELVRKRRHVAGTLAHTEAVAQLRPLFHLREWPDHAGDWARIAHLSDVALSRIVDSVGGRVTLPPARQTAQIEAVSADHPRVSVLGSTGIGKSAATKQWALAIGTQVMWIDASDLSNHSWAAFEMALGLTYPLNELFEQVTSPGILVIDGLDRTYDVAALNNAAQLVRLAAPTDRDNGWRAVLPCLTDEWPRVSDVMDRGGTGPWQTTTLAPYEATDLQSVWQAFPQAGGFAQQRHLAPLLSNLKIVDLVVRQLVQHQQVLPRFVGESDISDWYWTQVIESLPRAIRAQFIKSVAREQAERSVARVPLSALPSALLSVTDALIAEQICESADERIWFEHDLLGDWARLRVLVEQPDEDRRTFVNSHLAV
ncbi:hypothetical protein [Deinococcus sp. ME38]|uniref:hypothetical protein n=1 Tax=Deinococcus sp. ME38 TaxID=3400344 RepID=UPI003B58C172